MPLPLPTNLDSIYPLFRVTDIHASVRYYVDILGFNEVTWGDDAFTCVLFNDTALYLGRGDPNRGAWVPITVSDVRTLYQTYRSRGAIIRQASDSGTNTFEMQVEDPDGNLLRFSPESESGD
jgi:catechol 2,3-dioxygenase-like lactoylglutathione lyase family enzyme